MSIANRIKKLEQRPEAEKPGATIIYVYDGKSKTEAEAAEQKAITEYRTKHPDWEPSWKDFYIHVENEHTKELVERIARGERTEKR
jgi:hypothetical protein